MSAKQEKPLAPRLCERTCRSTGRPLSYATFNGRYVSFGQSGPDATRRYEEFVARWLANGRRLEDVVPAKAYTVQDLVLDFLDHALAFYGSAANGRPGGEYLNLRCALTPLQEAFGALPAENFGPVALRAVREQMVQGGRLCRREINARVHRIRRAFRWAVSMEKVPATVVQALDTVDGLRIGKTTARESSPVLPVAEREVQLVTAQLCPTVAAMVWFQWWTGCRPGEACALRWGMIDRTGSVWIAELERHKTAHRGRRRVLSIGPKAQEAIRPLMDLDPQAFVFSPRRAVAEQRAAKRERRRSKVSPSQQRRAERSHANPREEIAEAFTVHTLRRAIARAVRAANAAMVRERVLVTVEQLRDPVDAAAARPAVAWLSIERCVAESGELLLTESQLQHMLGDDAAAAAARAACEQLHLLQAWGPNRLRHSAATRLRREEGLEAARVVLGHARAAVTEIYAEADHERSREIMQRLG